MKTSQGSESLVSIGLPVYNGERSVGRVLDSLLRQDYENIELIISDNASTDKTEEICRSYAAKDPRVRYHRNETNLGQKHNFQYVIKASSGRYFMWAAHDDLWEPGFVSKLMEAFEASDDVLLSCCDYDVLYHQSGRFEPHGMPLPRLSWKQSVFENAVAMLTRPHSPFIYGIFKTEALKSISTIWRKAVFDFGDLVVLNVVTLSGKVNLTEEVLFHSGVKDAERPPVSFSRRRLFGFKFAYGRYYLETSKRIARCERITAKEKARLLLLLTNQVLNLMSGHESLPRILKKSIELEFHCSDFLANRVLSLPKGKIK